MTQRVSEFDEHEDFEMSAEIGRLLKETEDLAKSTKGILTSFTQLEELKGKNLSRLANALYHFINSHTKRGRERKREFLNIASKNNAITMDMIHNLFDEDYLKLQQNTDKILENLQKLFSLDKKNLGLILPIYTHKSLKAIIDALAFDSYDEVSVVIDDLENKIQERTPKNMVEGTFYSSAQIILALLKNIRIYENGNKIIDADAKSIIFDSISSSFEKIYDEISKFNIETELLFFDTFAHISLLWAIKVEESAYRIAKRKNDFESLKTFTLHLCSLFEKIASRLWAFGSKKILEYKDKELDTIDTTKPLFFADENFSKDLEEAEMDAKRVKLFVSSIFSNDLNGIDSAITMTDELKEKVDDEKLKDFLDFSKKNYILAKLWIQFGTSYQQRKVDSAKDFISKILALAEEIKASPPIDLPEEMSRDALVTPSKKGEYARMQSESQINLATGMSILLDEKSKEIPSRKGVGNAKDYLRKSSKFSPELVRSMRIDSFAYNELAECYEKIGEKFEGDKQLEEAKSHFDLATKYYKLAGKIALLFTTPDAKSNLCDIKAGYIQALIDSRNKNFKTAIQQCEKSMDKIKETRMFLDNMEILEFSDISPSQIITELDYLDQHITDLKGRVKQNRKKIKEGQIAMVVMATIIALVVSILFVSGYIDILKAVVGYIFIPIITLLIQHFLKSKLSVE